VPTPWRRLAVMTPTRGAAGNHPSYALEVHIRGVIHIQVERLPPVITTALTAVTSSVITWLAAHGLHW
jgi:hypothetical protein